MGLELRKVPKDWQHPKNNQGGYIPLLPDFSSEVIDWLKEPENVPEPRPQNFMPDWSKEERTHFQLYENVTEGTPVSPVMDSAKTLAEWLSGNLSKNGWTHHQFPAKTWLEILTSDNPVVYLVMSKRR